MTAPGFPESTHLDPDLLADLAEGLLDDPAADAARRHIVSCAACSGDYALINGLADIAWDAIEPEPIPAEVVARVEAALHREPPLKPASHPAGEREVRKAPSRRFQLVFKILAGAGAVVVAGYFGVSALSSTSESKSSAAGAASAPSPQDKSAPRVPNAAASPNAGSALAAGDLAAIQRRATELLSAPGGASSATSTHSMTTAAGAQPSASPDSLTCWSALRPNARLLRSEPYPDQGAASELLIFTVPADSTQAEVVIAPATCPAKVITATMIAIP